MRKYFWNRNGNVLSTPKGVTSVQHNAEFFEVIKFETKYCRLRPAYPMWDMPYKIIIIKKKNK